jgi:hypothetical protein
LLIIVFDMVGPAWQLVSCSRQACTDPSRLCPDWHCCCCCCCCCWHCCCCPPLHSPPSCWLVPRPCSGTTPLLPHPVGTMWQQQATAAWCHSSGCSAATAAAAVVTLHPLLLLAANRQQQAQGQTHRSPVRTLPGTVPSLVVWVRERRTLAALSGSWCMLPRCCARMVGR